ncbi:hypothetical protein MWH06_00620 [Wolbachia pipientis]|nr:hypothetical protein MWH06_00620 [Wolbachia pipientis]
MKKKAKEALWWLAIYYVLKYRRFFILKRLIKSDLAAFNLQLTYTASV